MPTGYTYPIVEKGIGFKEFAMSCARAFGACVELRDEPLDAPIPEKFEPSDYHVKELAAARDELRVLEAMGREARIAFGNARLAVGTRQAEEALAKRKVENERLEAVERDVLEWIPPTSEHEGLKSFMLEQIKISKDNSDYWQEALDKIKRKTPMNVWLDAVNSAKRGIAYHTDEARKDRERAESRTRWIQQLRDSLNTQPIAVSTKL